MKEISKKVLVRLSACEGCNKPCKFNSLVTVEKTDKSFKYNCNSSK